MNTLGFGFFLFSALVSRGSFAVEAPIQRDNAENCSTIRLDKSTKALKWVPAWQQGKSEICWAAAAAQLIDAERFRTGQQTEQPTSPLNLASQTYVSEHNGYVITLKGFSEIALTVAKEEGICEPTGGFRGGVGNVSIEHVFERIRQLYRLRSWAQFTPLKNSDLPAIRKTFNMTAKELPEMVDLLKQPLKPEPIECDPTKVEAALKALGFPAHLTPTAKVVMAALQLDSESAFIKAVLAKTCLRKIPVSLPKVKIGTLSEIDSVLKNDKPVIVHYCWNFITNEDECSPHVGVVVGRELQNGVCQYLIRDSSCDEYNQKKSGSCIDGQFFRPRTSAPSWMEDKIVHF